MEDGVQQKCVTFGTTMVPPFSYQYPGPDGKLVSVGVMVEVSKIILANFGLCYEIAPYFVVGNQFPNGTWSGLMRRFQDKTIDFGGTAFSINTKRATILDYHVMFVTTHNLVFKAPVIEADLLGFIKPFTYESWITIALFLVFMILFLWFIRKLGSAIPRGVTETDSHLYHAVSTSLRSLLAQDVYDYNVTLDRIAVGTMMLSCFIIGTVYKSNLMAMLITPRIVRPFDSLADLIETDLDFIVSDGSYLAEILQSSPEDSLFGRANKRVTEYREIKSVNRAMREIANGEWVHGNFEYPLRWGIHTAFQQTRACAYMLARESYLPLILGVPMTKGGRLNKRLVKALMGIMEFGIIDKILTDSIYWAAQCETINTDQGLRALTIFDFLGLFAIFGSCMFLGILAFIVEICIHPDKKKKKMIVFQPER